MHVTIPTTARTLTARRSGALRGVVRAPSDKSISHRALLFAAAAEGESRVHALSDGADVRATLQAIRTLGCEVEERSGVLYVRSGGLTGFASPERPLDFGNSGTGVRLAMGLATGAGVTATFIGDHSLSGRPMGRVLEPLAKIGAAALARDGGRLPLTLTGPAAPKGVRHEPPVASAQVKSAILFAGLGAAAETTVVEKRATRDHTERMAPGFGARIESEHSADGAVWVQLAGGADLRGAEVTVPGDPSSAAFIAAAAAITPGSEVRIEGVCANPGRFGFFRALEAMGADMRIEDKGVSGGEPIVDVTVRTSDFCGLDAAEHEAPAMIDEYPILGVLCALARGPSRLRGLAELRVKESDRFAAILDGLTAVGARAEADGDDIVIEGAGAPPAGGARVATRGDHRIAMSFAIMGLSTREPVVVDEPAMIATSWPGFVAMMAGLGADMRLENGDEA